MFSSVFKKSKEASPFHDIKHDIFQSKGGDPKRPSQDHEVKKSTQEWQDDLGPAFPVMRRGGTESPYSSKYDKHYPDKNGTGLYRCMGCNAALYTANQKFNSGCGWPAFFDAVPGAVGRNRNMNAVRGQEIWCNACGAHLGHVFTGEGFKNPTDERHCVNGVCLNFTEDDAVDTANGQTNGAKPEASTVTS